MPEMKTVVKRIYNCVPSRQIERDWTFAHAQKAGVLAAAPPIPASKDLREKWWTVGDQKYTGSCVGWATADGMLRWHFVKNNELAPDARLSPRFFWMAAKETDEFIEQPTTFLELEGTSLKAALDIARNFGAVEDSILPFDSGLLYQDEAKVFYALAAKLKIASYFSLVIDPSKWREWIARAGPILTRLDVDSTWENATATKGKLETYDAGNTRGGHAVAMVGYTADTFIIRNSWGTSWGDGGFAYASDAYAQAAFTEAYGVTL